MINIEFEKNGKRFTPNKIILFEEVVGRWWTKEAWDSNNETWNFKSRKFIPLRLAPTKHEILDCFSIGSAFVLEKKRLKRRKRWLTCIAA